MRSNKRLVCLWSISHVYYTNAIESITEGKSDKFYENMCVYGLEA